MSIPPTKEEELQKALQAAESSGDPIEIEKANSDLALYYWVTNQFHAAAGYWRRGAELLARSTAPDSVELGNYLLNMAEYCLIPAGLHEEARTTLSRAKEIYQRHFRADDKLICHIDSRLKNLSNEPNS